MGNPKTKLKPKPQPESFDAFQWRGVTPGWDRIQSGDFDELTSTVDHMLAFEEWVKETLGKKRVKDFKYRGQNLIYDTGWGEIVIKPSFWIVLIPNEDDIIEVNVMTNEQIESYYVHADRQ